MFSFLFASLLVVTAVNAQTGLPVQQVNGRFGSFPSHAGYPNTPYPRQQTRFIVNFPAGQTGQVGIDVTDPTSFSLRLYDFAVIMDASIASKVIHPCDVNSYTAAGLRDVDYVSITMTNRAQARVLQSKSDHVFVDFCPSTYDSGRNDLTMKGFRVYFMAAFTPVQPPTTMMPPSSTSLPTGASSPMPTTSGPVFSSTGAPGSTTNGPVFSSTGAPGSTMSPSSVPPSPSGSTNSASSTGAMGSSTVAPVQTSTPAVSLGTSSGVVAGSTTGPVVQTSVPSVSSSVNSTPIPGSTTPVLPVATTTFAPVTGAPANNGAQASSTAASPPAAEFAHRAFMSF